MRQTQAVILDLDGLMIDSEPLHHREFEMLLARHGVEHKFTIEEYGRYFVGIPVKENAEWVVAHFNLKGTREDLVAEREGIDEALLSDPSNLATMPGLIRLLDDLSECGLPLGVASGSPRNQVDMILRGLQIDGRFRAVVAGDDVLHPKPAPDVYLRVTEELGVAPTLCCD